MRSIRARQYANIPVFIPHLGCPNACVFCNQHSISGHGIFRAESVRDEIEQALATLADCAHCEIAFFGGSFTGIDRTLMTELLEIAQSYVREGRVDAIRLSTRPDYVDDEVLSLLSRYAVKTVELGLQSINDRVLRVTRRGHDAAAAEYACRKIKEYGFDLVGQMMIGLPASSASDEQMTAQRILELGADAARVYPTVVFRQTELCRMAERGEYTLLPQEEMIARTANVLELFDDASVPVIRVGLCASENLANADEVYGGANESAVGELAMGEVFYRRMRAALVGVRAERQIRFAVPVGAISQAVGQRRKNTERLRAEFGIDRIRFVEDSRLCGYQIQLLL